MKSFADPFQVVIEIDGKPIGADSVRARPSVRVQQKLSLPTMCEIAFVDPCGPLRDGRSVRPGMSLSVRVAPHIEPLFQGDVTAIDYAVGSDGIREIRVRGYDRLHRLRKRQQVKTHDDLTTVDLIHALVKEDGLSVDVGPEVGAGEPRRKVFQNRQTDFDLLNEQARRAGIGFVLRGTTMTLLTYDGIGEAIELTVGDELMEARIGCNGDSTCRSVQTSAWNFGRAEAHRGVANSSRTGRGVAAEVLPEAFGIPGDRFIAGEVVQDDAEALAVAQAELDRRGVGAVTFWGVADGDPLLRPGQPVKVGGISALFDGIYTLTNATHILDDVRGYQTELSSAPLPRIDAMTGTVVTLGIVKRVDDPDSLGRLQVTLPAYNDAQTDWIGVVTAGAGKGKGLISLPDIDDQVLVLCSQEDLAQGVVVGGLYGANSPPDSGVDGGAVRRFSFVTPGGQLVRLDDGKRAVHIQNSTGSFVDLSPNLVTVHAAGDLVLEAPGHGVKVRGSRIDFERADS